MNLSKCIALAIARAGVTVHLPARSLSNTDFFLFDLISLRVCLQEQKIKCVLTVWFWIFLHRVLFWVVVSPESSAVWGNYRTLRWGLTEQALAVIVWVSRLDHLVLPGLCLLWREELPPHILPTMNSTHDARVTERPRMLSCCNRPESSKTVN